MAFYSGFNIYCLMCIYKASRRLQFFQLSETLKKKTKISLDLELNCNFCKYHLSKLFNFSPSSSHTSTPLKSFQSKPINIHRAEKSIQMESTFRNDVRNDVGNDFYGISCAKTKCHVFKKK